MKIKKVISGVENADSRFYIADMMTALLTLNPLKISLTRGSDEFAGIYYNLIVTLEEEDGIESVLAQANMEMESTDAPGY